MINTMDAQRRRKPKLERFAAGLILGYSFSQIDGDDYTGYDRGAPLFGFQVSTQIHRKWSLDVNFTYVRKGANIENEVYDFRVNLDKDRFIHLDYAEVPILLKYRPMGDESRFYVEGGFSYGKMLNSNITERVTEFTEVIYADIEGDFKKDEINAIIGFGSALNKDLTIGMRFSYGLNKFYINESPIEKINYSIYYPKEILFLRNYYLSAVISYRVF
jgi:hypothetical protein